MAQFLKHEPCPECGSKDNLAVYDTFKKCMTPNCNYSEKYSDDMPQKNFSGVVYRKGTKPLILVTERKLNDEVIDKYGVSLRTSGKAQIVSFPYYDTKIEAIKNRGFKDRYGNDIWLDKKFYFEGNTSKAPLFGTQTLSKKKSGVIITEGEIDCLAAYQMYGLRYNVVSVGTGAKGAKQQLIKSAKKLKGYEIILCFDNDEPGQQASMECMQIFPKGSVRNVILPEEYKDASDMLIAGEEQLFRECINQAQADEPDCVIDKDTMVKETLAYIYDVDDTQQGVSSGFDEFDEISGGLRGGEVITLVAGTGVGKSSFSFNLAYNTVVKEQAPTLFIPLEMIYKTVVTRLIEIDLGKPLITPGDNLALEVVSKDMIKKSAQKISNNLYVFNHTGFLEIQELISSIEFYCRCYGIKFVILDHIHAAVNSGGAESDYKMIDFLIAELKRVALQNNCCILAISHMSRSKQDLADNKPTLNRIRGSQGIAQNSDLVIGMSRPRDTTQAVFETLKPHRLFGIYKAFILDYNKDTLRYDDRTTFTVSEDLFNGKETDEFEGEQDIQWKSVPKQIREGDSKREQTPTHAIRTDKTTLSGQLHTRLSASDENRETNIYRSEGMVYGSGQVEAKKSEEIESDNRLEITFDVPEQKDKSKTQEIINLL